MENKRIKQIAIRITEETDEILEKEAKKLKWTKASLANEILTEWAKKSKETGGSIQFIKNHIENINIGGK